MGVSSFSFLLFFGILGGTMGSTDIPSLELKVTQLEDSLTTMLDSIHLTIQVEKDQILLTVLDEVAERLDVCCDATNDIPQLDEAVLKTLQVLLSNQSLRMEQLEAKMNRQTVLINKLSSQLKNAQSLASCVGEPPSPRNGRPVNLERKHGSDVKYECDENFLMTSNSTVRCNAGSWEGQPPVCSLAGCDSEPPSPPNGRHVGFDQNNGSPVLYQCDPNSLMIRNSTVRCNAGKWEGQPPVCSVFDTTFLLWARRDKFDVACSSEGNPQKIKFSRALDTGTGGAVPSTAKTSTQGKSAVLDLSGVYFVDRRGAYHCGYEGEGLPMGISFQMNRYFWLVRPQVASIGDTVEFDSVISADPSLRWFHDRQRIPAWDGLGRVTIAAVRAADSGIYELHRDGDWRDSQHFFRLVVRACGVNVFGERCDKECPACYNGGACHDLFGLCVCPPGFHGSSCEVACGENRFGPNCSESCVRGDCKGQLFCKPDPYGCSCAPGYWGNQCNVKGCATGKYGADCTQTCHCASGSCDPYTGVCSRGCANGWTGQSCQVPVRN